MPQETSLQGCALIRRHSVNTDTLIAVIALEKTTREVTDDACHQYACTVGASEL
jgi:hypothetical protein